MASVPILIATGLSADVAAGVAEVVGEADLVAQPAASSRTAASAATRMRLDVRTVRGMQ